MKMMKRFTSIMLVLCMVLSLVPAITLGASAAGDYTLVTNVSDLSVGDKVVIVAKDSNYALSTNQKSNNRGQASVTKDGNTLSITADVQTLTLEAGTIGGTFAFNTGSGYLYAASSSSNYLRTQTTNNDNGSWEITIAADGTATVVAQGTNTRNVMQHNSSDSLFACYASASQKAITIYKQTASTGAECTHTNTTTTTVDATCTTEGSKTVTCSDCGKTVSTTTIPVIDHNYVSGTCSMCGAADPSADTNDYSGRYYIATVRSSGNYYYMTNDLGTATDKRYQAVDSGLTTLPSTIAEEDVVSNQVFVLEKNTDGTYMIYAEGISGDNKYLGWTSGNTGTLVAVASALNLTVTPNGSAYNIHFAASDEERYLSLNGTSGNNYFAWYKGTQKQNLTLIPVNGDGSGGTGGESGGEEGGDTTVTTVATIKIITGIGKAWFVDSEGNKYALRDDSHNPLGTEATEKAQVYRADVPTNGTITLVLQPDATQRLACIEQSSDRLEPSAYPYDSAHGYFTYTFTASATTTDNYFRITFLPRLADGGYTAVQATESATGAAITPGIYVMTGLRTDETYTTNAHNVDTTYLLYADTYTVEDDSYAAVGRKSSALQLSSVGVFLNTEDPYLMTAVNKNHLVNIQTSGDYYTIGLVGAEGYYLKSTTNSKNNYLYATNNTSDAGVLWDITYLSDGAYQITNVDTGRYLLFNSDKENLQFRSYKPDSSVTLAENAPVLYRADKVSQLVTYTVSTGTETGSIHANNNSTASAVASGTYQTIDSELTFTFTPAFGYQLDSVTVNGETVTLTDSTYTCTVVEGTDIHVVANYSQIPADRDITVNYYVNNELKHTVTAEASLTYTLDIANLPAVDVGGKSYKFDQLSFIETVNGSAVYTDLQAAILVEDGDEINVYFSTTEVTLNKTVTETTDKNTTVNDKNGGLNSENFTDSNDKDTHGNVKQTFEVELYAQSFSHSEDVITGNTDVIVVLDNSNSMHYKDIRETVSGYLSAVSSNEDGLGIVSEVDANAIWSINITNGVATITSQGSYTHNTIAFDSNNNLFSAYLPNHSLGGLSIWRYNSSESKWEKVTDALSLASGNLVAILDSSTTNFGMGNSQDVGARLAVDTEETIAPSIAFTLGTANGGYTFHSASTDILGYTNSEYTLDALDGFYDRVFAATGNRVGIVKFNSYGYVWDGNEYLVYNGSRDPNQYTGITYDNCFVSTKEDAIQASVAAIGTKETDDGGTNFVGAWRMIQVLATTRDTATDRNLVILFFTDGQPTVSYEFTGYVEDGTHYIGWSTDSSDMHPISSDSYGGMNTSAGEYYYAMLLAQHVKYTLTSSYNSGVSIHNVALLNDSSLDVELVDMFMSSDSNVIKQWKYDPVDDVGYPPLTTSGSFYDSSYSKHYIYKYGNLSDWKDQPAYWTSITPYADSYTSVTGNVSNSLNAAFDSIAVTITPGKVVEGTIVDTIPADFTLTPESAAALVEAGWTVTPNDDGTTTITKPNVQADIDGETFTYEIQYQGDGYGAEYTNVEAKYIYEGVDDQVTYESYFPMPVVNVIPWTVNDGYTADTNVAVTLDVLKNDLFEELTAGGYTLSNFTVTLTDINGKEATYFNAQAGGFDAVVDPASNTVSFTTEQGGNHVFYYVVSATVTAPDGTKTVVYSRATRVDVLTVSAENVNDLDVLMAGQSGSINLLHNDTFAAGAGTTSNSITLTDSNGDPLDPTQLSAIKDVTVNAATGDLTYTAVHSGVEQFWYVNQITASDESGNTVTVSTPPTKVTILVLDNAALVVDYGYTTQPLQAHPDLSGYTVADGVTLDSVVKVNYPALTGTYGTAAFTNGTFTFTPATTMYKGIDVFTYSAEVTENPYSVRTATYAPTVTVVPANSIYFEESFLTYAATGVDLNNNALSLWTDEGTAANRTQGTANILYGSDAAYSAYTESYSDGSAKLTTVTEANPTAVAYFTFSGTGFDLYGLSSQDTGFLLAEVYTYDSTKDNGLGKLQKYVMVDTYIQGKTYEQLPILCCRDLAYGDYAVKIRVVYEKAFDHNLTATRNEGIKSEDYYRQLLGLQAGIPMELSLSESASPATRSVPSAVYGSYSIVIDGLRIYQPLNATPEITAASELYQEANELGLSFYRVRDLLLSADQWADAGSNVNGLVYIAADANYTGAADQFSGVGTLAPIVEGEDAAESGSGESADTAVDTESVYLTPTQTLKVDSKGALIDPTTGVQATIDVDGTKYGIFAELVPGRVDGYRYAYYYKVGETKVSITPEQIDALGLMHTANYYAAIGPKYELYLTNGNGIAFNLTAGQLLHLSAKLPVGQSAELQAYVNGQWVKAATVSSRTELYFDLSSCINSDGSVILKCVASEDAVLSLCNIKTASTVSVSQKSIRMAASLINGKEIKDNSGFHMGHTVSFDSDLKMNYRIRYSALAELVPNYVAEGAYLVVEKDRYFTNGETAVETVTLTADLTSDPERMIFVLGGIQSVEMGSELRATLHFFDAEGKEHTAPVDTYSVLAYAKECFRNSTDTRLYTMVIDLLNYGAAAQLYFNRNAANPVNAGLDAYQKYSSTALSAELSDEMTVAGGTATAVSKIGFAVNFADRTEIKVKLSLAEGYTAEDITSVKVLDENGNVVEVLTDLAEIEDGKLEATFSGVTSVCMRRMYYFVAYSADQAVSETVGFSVEAYVKGSMDPAKVSFTELLSRCIYYGDAAEAYFKD